VRVSGRDTRLVDKHNLFILEVLKDLDRSGEKESEDHPPSWIRQVRCGWRDDLAEVENAMIGTRQDAELHIPRER
jgi:hypothetical protein